MLCSVVHSPWLRKESSERARFSWEQCDLLMQRASRQADAAHMPGTQGTAHQVAEGVPEVAETASRQVERLAGGLEKELPKVWRQPGPATRWTSP